MHRRPDGRRAPRLLAAGLAALAVAVVAIAPVRALAAGPDATPSPASTPVPTDDPSAGDSGSGGPCDMSPVLGVFCSIGKAIDGVPGDIASGIGDSIVGAVTRWVADGAAWVLQQVTDLVESSTSPDLGARWFRENYATMVQLGAMLLTVFLLLATVQGLLHGSPSMILRAYLLHAPVAILGTLLAIAIVTQGLAATDAMSSAVSAHLGHDVGRIAERVGDAAVAASLVTGSSSLFVAFLGALAAVVVALLLWIELLIRQAAVDICVLFLPLVLAAMVWPATARSLRRLVNTLVAVVLSKFVIVAVLALAASALASDVDDGGVKAILVGVVLLLLAALCPYMLFRLLPGVETAMAARWMARGAGRAVRSAPGGSGHALGGLRSAGSGGGRAAAGGAAGGASAVAMVAASGAARSSSSSVRPAERLTSAAARGGPDAPRTSAPPQNLPPWRIDTRSSADERPQPGGGRPRPAGAPDGGDD